jgi:ParB family transcriptional regulator, chromosome partitioning protein
MTETTNGYETGKMYELNISEVSPNISQPRKYFDEQAMEELKASIQKHGVLQPILVRNGDEGKFVVVSGERRYQASLAAGLSTIPALLTDGNPAEISIVENLLRENLTAIEEAEAIESLRTAHSYQLGDLSQVLGKAESTLSEILSLNKLPDEVKNDCRSDPKTARGILVEVAKERTPEKMSLLYQKYKASGLTRGEIRKLAVKPKVTDAPIDVGFVSSFTKRLSGIDLAKLDEGQTGPFGNALDELRLEVNRKLRKLKAPPDAT